MPPARWPTKTVAKRARAIERIAHDLQTNEDDAGLPETRLPDPALHARYVVSAQRAPLRRVVSNSFGFGGSNCSLVLART